VERRRTSSASDGGYEKRGSVSFLPLGSFPGGSYGTFRGQGDPQTDVDDETTFSVSSKINFLNLDLYYLKNWSGKV